MPNYKKVYKISSIHKEYPCNQLKLIYFSRVETNKGIYDLIETIASINQEYKFNLDIYGLIASKKDKKKIKYFQKKYPWLSYKGCLSLVSQEQYEKLSSYDLHVFPTLYGEGFPGTIIDFFIAGVPTLSSSFARYNEILSEKESYIYEQGNNEKLRNSLKNIFDNQIDLLNKRQLVFGKADAYSLNILEKFIVKELL